MSEQQEKQKWRVEKRDGWIIGTYWTAFQGEEAWFVPTPRFDTWAEAMQEADRMARTITVTLPRNVKRITVGPKTWMELRDDGGVTLHAEGTSIGIRKTHLEKAVLALLAHARKETP